MSRYEKGQYIQKYDAHVFGSKDFAHDDCYVGDSVSYFHTPSGYFHSENGGWCGHGGVEKKANKASPEAMSVDGYYTYIGKTGSK